MTQNKEAEEQRQKQVDQTIIVQWNDISKVNTLEGRKRLPSMEEESYPQSIDLIWFIEFPKG